MPFCCVEHGRVYPALNISLAQTEYNVDICYIWIYLARGLRGLRVKPELPTLVDRMLIEYPSTFCHYRDKPSDFEGLPVRRWSIEVFLLNEHGEEIPATLFSQVTYTLHPSFGERAVQG